MMSNFKIILHEPDIPQNTGNIIRLCANTGNELHLVKPMGFPLDDKKLRRSGLDYHEYTNIVVHENWQTCMKYFTSQKNHQIWAIETSGEYYYHEADLRVGDIFLFGSETRGLPQNILDQIPRSNILKLPMQQGQRSLNLSNSVAILVYEAWRKNGFIGAINEKFC